MAVTLKEVEEIPASYPDAPANLSAAAAALDTDAIWQRIEAYCSRRWTTREVVWIVEDNGDWCPPLSPLTITSEEVWNGEGWETATDLYASPYGGYRLTTEGPHRFTGTAGGVDVPAAVSEAFRRLAEYLADEPDRAGVSSYSVNMGGAIEESYQRNPAWVARAMELSGAADLLRPWKRRF
ncbi:hypothetical protein [Celeribacter persicus]|uniref:PhiE125 gp8 family phage protein n=1 Tax=Celeribacter persicus TaxID=1651082 RepID=A0A2T5HMF0_9RHOB|nr:hypothetical protein [Celeribacter persicus]PTQ72736.1 hypothetical protein C8N42_106248 [Celeribacter persicus]